MLYVLFKGENQSKNYLVCLAHLRSSDGSGRNFSRHLILKIAILIQHRSIVFELFLSMVDINRVQVWAWVSVIVFYRDYCSHIDGGLSMKTGLSHVFSLSWTGWFTNTFIRRYFFHISHVLTAVFRGNVLVKGWFKNDVGLIREGILCDLVEDFILVRSLGAFWLVLRSSKFRFYWCNECIFALNFTVSLKELTLL